MDITEERLSFERRIARYAALNGFTRRKHLWMDGASYISIGLDSDGFHAILRAVGSGNELKRLCIPA